MPLHPFSDNLGFRETRDIFKGAQDRGDFSDFNQVGFSKFAQNLSGNPELFGAADSYSDLFLKSAPDFIDRTLEQFAQPVLEKSGELFEGIASSLGATQGVGTEVGRSLPGSLVDFAPLIGGSIAAAPLTGGTSLLVGGAGLLGTALLSGMRAFRDTDSPTAGLVTGGITAALPGIAALGGKAAVAAGTKVAPKLIGQPGAINKLTNYAGGQMAALSTETTADFMQSDQSFGEYFTNRDNLIAQAISELPFAIADIPRGLKGLKPRLQAEKTKLVDSFRDDDHSGRSAVEAADKSLFEDEIPGVDVISSEAEPISVREAAATPEEALQLDLIGAVEMLMDGKKDKLRSLEKPDASARYSENLQILENAYNTAIGEVQGFVEGKGSSKLLGLESHEIHDIVDRVKSKHGIDQLVDNVTVFPEDQVYAKVFEEASNLDGLETERFVNAEHVQGFYQKLGGDSRVTSGEFLEFVDSEIPVTLESFNNVLGSAQGIIPTIDPYVLKDQSYDPVTDGDFTDIAMALYDINAEQFEMDFDPVTDDVVNRDIQEGLDEYDLDVGDAVDQAVLKASEGLKLKKDARSSLGIPEIARTPDENADGYDQGVYQDQIGDAMDHLYEFANSHGIDGVLPERSEARKQFRSSGVDEAQVFYNGLLSKVKGAADPVLFEAEANLSKERGDLVPGSLDDTIKRIGVSEGLDAYGQGLLKDTLTKVQEYIPASLDMVGFIDNLKSGQENQHLGLAQTTVRGVQRVFLGAVNNPNGVSAKTLQQMHGFVFGHELAHTVDQNFKSGRLTGKLGKSYREFSHWADRANPRDIADLLDVMQQRLPKEFRDSPEIKQLLQNVSGDELRANVHALWALNALNGGGVDAQIGATLMPREPRKMFKELNTMAKRLLRGTKRFLGLGSDTQVRVEEFGKLFEDMQKASQGAESDIAEFAKIAHVSTERLTNMDIPLEGSGEIIELMNPATIKNLDKEGGIVGQGVTNKTLAALSWLVEKPAQMAARYPVTKGIYASLTKHNAGVRGMTHRVMGPLMDPLANNSTAKNQEYFKTTQGYDKRSNVLNEFLGKMLLRQNDLPEIQDFKTMTPEQRSEWSNFSPDEQKIVQSQFEKTIESSQNLDKEIAQSDIEVAYAGVAKYISTKISSEQWNTAKPLAKRLVDAHAQLLATQNALVPDPQMLSLAESSLQEIGLDMLRNNQVKTFQMASAMSKKLMDGRQKFLNSRNERPVNFNTRRTGKYELTWVNEDGSPGRFRYKSKANLKQHKAWLKERGRKGFEETIPDKGGNFFDMDDDKQSFYDTLDKERFDFIDQLDVGEADKAQLKAMVETSQEWRSAINDNRDIQPTLAKPRQHNNGAEFLDMVENHRINVGITSRMMQNRILEADFDYEMTNPELATVPRAVQQFRQTKENYMNPDTEVGRFITKAMFTRFLGFNLSSHMLELSQPMFSVLPQMQANGVGSIDSIKMLRKAGQDVASLNMHLFRNRKKDEVLSDWKHSGMKDGEEIGAVMNQLNADGRVNLGSFDEALDTDMYSKLNTSVAIRKGKLLKTAEMIGKPISAYHDLSAKFYGAFTHTNTRLAGMLGWRMARQQRPDLKPFITDPLNPKKQILNPELYQLTTEFVGQTTFNEGRADRTTALYSGGDSALWRTTGMSMESLKGYTNSMLSMMARYGQHGYGAKDLNLTPKQRKDARTAFKTQMAVMFAASGALGMPFVGVAIAALEENTDLEINKGLREGLAKMFNEDSEFGGMLADVALDGFANKILGGAGLPADVGSRFAVGGIIGTDAYRGFSTDALFGPTGSTVRQIISGGKNLAGGKILEGVEDLVPQAWKKVVNLARNEGEVVDRYGQKLIDANTKDLIALGVGFNPQRLQKVRDITRIQARTREIQRRKLTRKYDQIAEVAMSDPRKAQEMLAEMEEESAGIHTAKAGAKRVSERIQDRTFAKDIRRDATRASSQSEQNYLRTLGNIYTPPSELSRVQMDDQIMQMLGQRSSTTSARLRQAQLMDTLQTVDPTLTRSQLLEQTKTKRPSFSGAPTTPFF